MKIYRILPAGDLGTINGVPVVVGDGLTPPELVDAANAELTRLGLGVLFGEFYTGANVTSFFMASLAGPPFVFVPSASWKWMTGETSSHTTAYYVAPSNGAWTPAYDPRLSAGRREWTRIKSSEPGAGLLARVLDSRTYFDLRLWLKTDERDRGAELLEAPVAVLPIGDSWFDGGDWTELNPNGWLTLRCSDPRGYEQPRLLGSNAGILEYELEMVRVK